MFREGLTKISSARRGVKAILILLVSVFAPHAKAFEANAIWLKGTPTLAQIRSVDPAKGVDEFTIRDNEEVALHVTYRHAATDGRKWSKVSYRMSIKGPDGKVTQPEENEKEIPAGEGIVADEHAGNWAVSHGGVTLSFTDRDRRGTYVVTITIKDHVANREVTRLTRVLLQ